MVISSECELGTNGMWVKYRGGEISKKNSSERSGIVILGYANVAHNKGTRE